MKRIIILSFALMLFCGAAWAKKEASGSPSIKFNETVWDFGTIKQDRPATHSFEFVNDGTGNLVILEATAECGCTKPEWPQKPIAPGKKGKVTVTFNPLTARGSFEKTVVVRTNGTPKKVRLKIRGVIAPN